MKWKNDCCRALALLVVIFMGGCQSIKVDSEPASSFSSSRFVPSEPACKRLITQGVTLPLDMYHAGVCYEQGLGVTRSDREASNYYMKAARWGVPEAVRALGRKGIPVPEPDLLRRQQKTEGEINSLHEAERRRRLEQEKARALRDSYWSTYPCYGHHCWPYHHRCRRGWCY